MRKISKTTEGVASSESSRGLNRSVSPSRGRRPEATKPKDHLDDLSPAKARRTYRTLDQSGPPGWQSAKLAFVETIQSRPSIPFEVRQVIASELLITKPNSLGAHLGFADRREIPQSILRQGPDVVIISAIKDNRNYRATYAQLRAELEDAGKNMKRAKLKKSLAGAQYYANKYYDASKNLTLADSTGYAFNGEARTTREWRDILLQAPTKMERKGVPA